MTSEPNSSYFDPIHDLYIKGNFRIAYGSTGEKKNEFNLAMRWDGKRKDDLGFPNVFGRKVWFIVHQDLMKPILAMLLTQPKSYVYIENVIDILKNELFCNNNASQE